MTTTRGDPGDQSQTGLNAETENALHLSNLFAGCGKICWGGAAGIHKDRKIEDRKMRWHAIFLSSIFLSAFVFRLRLCRAVNRYASALGLTVPSPNPNCCQAHISSRL